jgi:hypothetical protein
MRNFYPDLFSNRFYFTFIGKDVNRVFPVRSRLLNESIKYLSLFFFSAVRYFLAVTAVNFRLSFKSNSILTPANRFTGIISLSVWLDFYFEASAMPGLYFT